MLRFSVEQFRCFLKTTPAPIAPVTVLVGENSTGKTSYLAAIRAAFDYVGGRSAATLNSFNSDPFHLGAFDQIVNARRGTKSGKPQHFSIHLSADVESPIQTMRPRSEPLPPAVFVMEFEFRKSGSQPTLSSVTSTYHDYTIRFEYIDKKTAVIFTRGKFKFEMQDEEMSRYGITHLFSLETSYIFNFLNDILEYRVRGRKLKTPEFAFDAARVLDQAYEQSLRSIRSKSIRAIAPIRSKPRRTYDPKEDIRDAEGAYVPYRLARLKHDDKAAYAKVKKSLDEFGATSGLFDSIEIKQLGKTDSDPFQVIFKIKGTSSNLVDVGYGVSQAVPLVTDIVLQGDSAVFLIQQPEVHLHPRAQAEFASFVKNFAVRTNSIIILETHSDYILDRLRSHVRQDHDFSEKDMSIVYFEREKQLVGVYPVGVDENGEVVDAPATYRKFFFKEEMRTLGIIDVPHS